MGKQWGAERGCDLWHSWTLSRNRALCVKISPTWRARCFAVFGEGETEIIHLGVWMCVSCWNCVRVCWGMKFPRRLTLRMQHLGPHRGTGMRENTQRTHKRITNTLKDTHPRVSNRSESSQHSSTSNNTVWQWWWILTHTLSAVRHASLHSKSLHLSSQPSNPHSMSRTLWSYEVSVHQKRIL